MILVGYTSKELEHLKNTCELSNSENTSNHFSIRLLNGSHFLMRDVIRNNMFIGKKYVLEEDDVQGLILRTHILLGHAPYWIVDNYLKDAINIDSSNQLKNAVNKCQFLLLHKRQGEIRE